MTTSEKFYLASSNPGKLKEFLAIANVAAAGLTLELLRGFSELPIYPEEAPTFAENAVGKALHAATIADAAVCADDSGLVVPSLGGEPGVRSARYGGPGLDDTGRCARLLDALAGVRDRRARFRCVLVLAQDEEWISAEGTLDGEIADAPRGAGGFGYDPVFVLPERGRTLAEIAAEEKNALSHRAAAMRALVTRLRRGDGHVDSPEGES